MANSFCRRLNSEWAAINNETALIIYERATSEAHESLGDCLLFYTVSSSDRYAIENVSLLFNNVQCLLCKDYSIGIVNRFLFCLSVRHLQGAWYIVHNKPMKVTISVTITIGPTFKS